MKVKKKIKQIVFQLFFLFFLTVFNRTLCGQNTPTNNLNKWWDQTKPLTKNLSKQISPLLKKANTSIDSLNILDRFYNKEVLNLTGEEKKQIIGLTWQLASKLQDSLILSKIYLETGQIVFNENNFFTAQKYTIKAIKLAQKIANDTMLLKAYQRYIAFYLRAQKNDSVIILTDTIEKKYGHIKHPVWSAIYANKGIALEQKGEEEQAIKYYLKAYDIALKFNNKRGQVINLFNIGYIYNRLQQYEKALNYLKQSLILTQKYHIKDYEAYDYEQIGYAYAYMNKEKEAIKYYLKALDYFVHSGNKAYEALTLKNLASNYLNIDQPEKAKKLAEKAIKKSKAINLNFVTIGATQTLIMAFIDLGDIKKAENMLKNSKNAFDEMDLPTKIDLYSNLYKLYLKKGDYKKALTYYKASDKLQDSLLVNTKKEALREIETKYQAEKKAKENEILKAQQAQQSLKLIQQKQQNILLTGGLLVAFVFIGILSFFYVRIIKQKKMIENLQKELHHRIKNNLSVINTLVSQIKKEFDDIMFHSRLDDLQNRIASIYEIHKQLYKKDDISNVNLKNYIDKLATNIQKSFGNEQVKIDNKVKNNLNININKSFALGLFVNEFLTNSFKHAFKKGLGIIQIEAKPVNGNKLMVKLKDNGPGIDQNVIQNENTFGIKLMKALAKQLNGKLNINHENGFEIELIFNPAE